MRDAEQPDRDLTSRWGTRIAHGLRNEMFPPVNWLWTCLERIAIICLGTTSKKLKARLVIMMKRLVEAIDAIQLACCNLVAQPVGATVARYTYPPPKRWAGSPTQHVPAPTPVDSRPALFSSGLGSGALPPLTLGLVSCGGVGALLFTATYIVEGLTRPGYDASQQPISALSLGPGGWVQQVNFVVFGLLLVLSAVGWRRLLTPGLASIGFPLVQSLIGLCLIVVGFFSQDPAPGYPTGVIPGAPTVHGTIHTVAAYVVFLALAVAASSWRDVLLLNHVGAVGRRTR